MELIDKEELMERLRTRYSFHNIKGSHNDEIARTVIVSCMEAVERSRVVDDVAPVKRGHWIFETKKAVQWITTLGRNVQNVDTNGSAKKALETLNTFSARL